MNVDLDGSKIQSINKAVHSLCPLIDEQIKGKSFALYTEKQLRKELINCVLGSQVRHEMAVLASNNIERNGLLEDHWWVRPLEKHFKTLVFESLAGRVSGNNSKGGYRFPEMKSIQIAKIRDQLAKKQLTKRLMSCEDLFQLRRGLVTDFPGLGPKQASLFLRNIGRSFDFAILDVHVMRFMQIQRLLTPGNVAIGTLPSYERIEKIVIKYAKGLGYPVGYLDWAIWATMKAATEVYQ